MAHLSLKETNTCGRGWALEEKGTGLTWTWKRWSIISTSSKCIGNSEMQTPEEGCGTGTATWSRYLGSRKCLMDALIERTQRAVEFKTLIQLTITSQGKNSIFHLHWWSTGVLQYGANITYTAANKPQSGLLSNPLMYICSRNPRTSQALGFWSQRKLLVWSKVFSTAPSCNDSFPCSTTARWGPGQLPTAAGSPLSSTSAAAPQAQPGPRRRPPSRALPHQTLSSSTTSKCFMPIA